MTAIIEIKHLQKYYGKHMGVVDVSLTVQQGEIFGFIVSNGAGKSTTIRCLLGLIHKSKGDMSPFWQSLRQFNRGTCTYRLHAVRSHVLSQDKSQGCH